MTKAKTALSVLTTASFCLLASQAFAITADQAREIAQRLVEQHYRQVPQPSFVGLYDQPENRCLLNQNFQPSVQAEILDKKKTLAGQRYYLVMWEPGADVLFGSTKCVFVDEEDGRVLSAAEL